MGIAKQDISTSSHESLQKCDVFLRFPFLKRDEYQKDFEHLKSNLNLLSDLLVRRKRLQVKERERFQQKWNRKSFEQEFKSYEDMSISDKIALAHTLKLIKNINDDDEVDSFLGNNFEALTLTLNNISDEEKRININDEEMVKDINEILPKWNSSNNLYNRDGSIYLDRNCLAVAETNNSVAKVVEYGLRVDGVYDFDFSCADIQKSDKIVDEPWVKYVPINTYNLKWSDKAISEFSMPVEQIFGCRTPDGKFVRDIYFHVEGTDGEPSKIDISDWQLPKFEPKFKSDTKGKIFSCLIVDVLGKLVHSPTTKVMFKRLTLQVHSEVPLPENCMDHIFSESGEALACAINFKNQNHFLPLLLYNTSGTLRSDLFPTINSRLDMKFREVDYEHDLKLAKEAQNILIHLILASRDQQHCAVVSQKHLRELRQFLKKQQRPEKNKLSFSFDLHNFIVEKSNFQAILRKLDSISSAGVVFCAILVAGRLDANDIATLVAKGHASSSLRLLLLNYSQLLENLQITDSLNKVFVPPSLASEIKRPIKNYKQTSESLHDLMEFADNLYSSDPNALAFSKQSVRAVQEQIKSYSEWREKEKEWRAQKITDSTNNETDPDRYLDELYCLIISEDMVIVENHYKRSQSDCKVFHCNQTGLERTLSNQISNLSNLQCLVFLQAHLLSDVQKNYIAAKATEKKIKVCISSFFFLF